MAYQTQGGSEWRQTPNPVGEGRHWRPRNPYEQQQQGQSVGEKRVRERDDNSVAGGGATVREPSENPTDNPPGGDEPLVSEQKRARLEEEEGETSSTGDNKGAEGGSQDEEGKEPDKPGDMEHRRSLLEPISDKALRALNLDVILMDRAGHFFCRLCYSRLNKVESFLKHIKGLEHERKAKMSVNWNNNKQHFPFFCELCVAPCTCEAMFQDHLIGKKHAKTVTVAQDLKRQQFAHVPPQLLTKLASGPPAKRVGNGISLGISPTMMRFFSLTGPFIGLNYAEEIGEEGDPCPRYFCHICRTHMDFNNTELHFTSTVHRHNVLAKDYPDLLAQTPRTGAKKDTERCARLAAEIEKREGRKVELISRKILQQGWKESALATVLGRRGGGGRGEVRGRGGGRGGYGTGSAGFDTWGQGGAGGKGGYGAPSSAFDNSLQGRGGGGRGRGGGEFGQRGRGNFQDGGRGGLFARGGRGRGGSNQRGLSGLAVRGWRGRGGEFGGTSGAYGGGVTAMERPGQQQGVFLRGRGGYNERGRGGYNERGRAGRGLLGGPRARGGGRGKERGWGDVLSQAYGGHTSSHGGGGETVNQDSWSDSYQSGSYDDDFSSHGNNEGGSGFHGSNRGCYRGNERVGFHGNNIGGDGFHGNNRGGSDEYWGSGEEWNKERVEPEYESETVAWRGGGRGWRGGEGHPGRGGHTREHDTYDRFSEPPTGTSSQVYQEGGGGGWEEEGEGGRRWEGWFSNASGHSESPHMRANPQPLQPVEHSGGYLEPPGHPHTPPPQQQSVSNKAEILKNLALYAINSEEDAEMALQLSSSLTQALLAYRIKNVPSASPLNEILSAVKGVSFPDPSNPSNNSEHMR